MHHHPSSAKKRVVPHLFSCASATIPPTHMSRVSCSTNQWVFNIFSFGLSGSSAPIGVCDKRHTHLMSLSIMMGGNAITKEQLCNNFVLVLDDFQYIAQVLRIPLYWKVTEATVSAVIVWVDRGVEYERLVVNEQRSQALYRDRILYTKERETKHKSPYIQYTKLHA